MVQHDTENRQFSIQWDDPMIGAQAAQEMSGLEYLQAIKDGKLPPPPITHLMSMTFHTVEAGRVVFAAQPGEQQYNPIGSVHGGFHATLLDSAMGCAIHTTLPKGTGYTTLQLNVHYLRPITTSLETVYCEGKSIHTGRKLATAEARITDADGKLYAHATTSCAVFTP